MTDGKKIQWTLDLIQKFLDAKIVEPARLRSIKNTLEDGNNVSDEDKNYLKEKFEQYKKIQGSKPPSTKTSSEPTSNKKDIPKRLRPLSNSSQSNLKEETQSLNQSGAFLQIHTINQLTKLGWETIVEFPVRAAPFMEDPKRHSIIRAQLLNLGYFNTDIFRKAIFDCRDYSFLEETSIDIVGTKIIGNKIFKICIKVKKLNPKYTDWCFIQQKSNYDNYRVMITSKKDDGLVPLFTVPQSNLLKEELSLRLEEFKTRYQTDFTIADFGIALYEKQTNPEFYTSEKTVVDKAARQIISGTYELTIEALIHRVQQGTKFDPGLEEIFIPVVVTNANLLHCEFDPSDIDPVTGQINRDPNYKNVNGIIYECATPKSVQYPDQVSRQLDAKERKYTGKWHVLIMSPEGLGHMLNLIETGSL